MIKKTLNQNAKYVQKLIDIIEPDFIYNNKPINRFKILKDTEDKGEQNKSEQLLGLKNKLIQLKIVI